MHYEFCSRVSCRALRGAIVRSGQAARICTILAGQIVVCFSGFKIDKVRHIVLKILVLTQCLNCATAAGQSDFVLENAGYRWVISDEGISESLLQKETGHELLRWSSMPVFQIKIADKTFPVTKIARQGKLYQATFGKSGVTAQITAEAIPNGFTFHLKEISGPRPQEFVLCQMDTTILKRNGYLVTNWHDENYVAALVGLGPKVHTYVVGQGGLRASLYDDLAMEGTGVVVAFSRKDEMFDTLRRIERRYNLPSPTIDGQWAKTSDAARQSYLFTDLTAANADETIRLAKMGGFKYIMIYWNFWSKSLGSYPINTKNFPDGEAGLKRVIDKCHAAGIKVGMHMLTSFVSKHDPLVTPVPDKRLLKDLESRLIGAIDADATTISLDERGTSFPVDAAHHGNAVEGRSLLIGDEIIIYEAVQRTSAGAVLTGCKRGAHGTTGAPHGAGEPAFHLAERYGSYLVDLQTSLKDEVASRVAGLINRCGFDMIYFDGGEVNSANGKKNEAWYWVGVQQSAVLEKVKRDLIVQGSGVTPWTWHYFTRGTCDDFSTLAPKAFLDEHKIEDSWEHYTNSFFPAELGWWGLLSDEPAHPATTPDEAELYFIRMAALDCPIGMETTLTDLQKNGRTTEILKMLRRYETLRLDDRFSTAVREQLKQGEWHLSSADGDASKSRPQLRPIEYTTDYADANGNVTLVNHFEEQPLKFRLQVTPKLADPGSTENLVLMETKGVAPELILPASEATTGTLAKFMQQPNDVPDQVFANLAVTGADWQTSGRKVLFDLSRHRALAVTTSWDLPGEKSGSRPDLVLNAQLETSSKFYRDHLVRFGKNPTGSHQTFIFRKPDAADIVGDLRPAVSNYYFKMAMYKFDYSKVALLNFRWMQGSREFVDWVKIHKVEALRETDVRVTSPVLVLNGRKLILPVTLNTGDYVELTDDDRRLKVFNADGELLDEIVLKEPIPRIRKGINVITVKEMPPGCGEFTLITMGRRIERM